MEIGISLKESFFKEVLESKPDIPFFEIHAENYLRFEGQNFEYLEEIAKSYPISIHCVGLSLGSEDPLNIKHLNNIARLNNKIKPILISEHLSFSLVAGQHFHDLLPVPYTTKALEIIATKIKQIQDHLGRQLLIENPSKYIDYKEQKYSETEFINLLVDKTDCGLIVDTNNIYVTSNNLNLDENKYLDNLPKQAVKEIHIAGPELDKKRNILIDTHSTKVRDRVLELTKNFTKDISPYILYEWDNEIPELSDFITEKKRVENILYG